MSRSQWRFLASDLTGSGRPATRVRSTRASERFKESELYWSWIFLCVQEKLFSIQFVDVEFVGNYLSSTFSLQIKPVEQCLLWLCEVIRSVERSTRLEAPKESWLDMSKRYRNGSRGERCRLPSGNARYRYWRLRAYAHFSQHGLNRHV